MSPMATGQAFTAFSSHERVPKGEAKGHLLPPHAPLQLTSPAQNLNALKVQMGEKLLVFSLPGLKLSLDSLESFLLFWGTKFWHILSGF